MLPTRKDSVSSLGCRLLWCLLAGFVLLPDVGTAQSSVGASPAEIKEPTLPEKLPLDAAVRWALQNNPELAAIRQQHGLAEAAVVIARTYPFNPSWGNKLFGVNGPPGVTNRVAMEQAVEIQLELHGQGRYRMQAASAGLSRTDWEIAFQEELLALRVIRAFDAVLYYDAKLKQGEKTVHDNEDIAAKVGNLIKDGVLKSSDIFPARTEVDSSRALLGAARVAQAKARQDLRRALGITTEPFTLLGSLDIPPCGGELDKLVALALERRPDLRARQLAIQESDARLQLAVADRLGNPTFGPDFEYNETRDYFIGAKLTLPLPLFNRRRGEILQREAERSRATLDLRNNEIVIRQEVQAALEHLASARAWAETYRKEVLPNLESSLKNALDLIAHGGIPILSVIDIQRKLLKARDDYLAVLYELSQAQADLAYSVGDPSLAILP
jgi:cobalt-zinc-cadmium efflux system outer membrane protein